MLKEYKLILQDILRMSDEIKKTSNFLLADFPKQMSISDVIIYCKINCLKPDCNGFALLNSKSSFTETIKCIKCGLRIDNIKHKGKKCLKQK